MRIPTRTIGLGLIGLTAYVPPLVALPLSNSSSHWIRVSSALPITNTTTPSLPGAINSTDTIFANNTQLVANETQLYVNETQLYANETQLVANDTPLMSWVTAPRQDHHSLFKRDLPPRDRKLADHMEHYGDGLPECYKKCMRSEDGKSSIHMGQVSQRLPESNAKWTTES